MIGDLLNFEYKRFSHVLDNLDTYSALLFIILGLLATIFLLGTNIRLVPAPITIIIFSAWYLLTRKNDLGDFFKLHASIKESKTLFILAFVFINLSFISFIFRPELYSRPLIYFITISVGSGFLAVAIMYLPDKKNYEYLSLLTILIIGLSLRLTPQLLFPDLLGIDPWTHRTFTNEIMSVGHIVSGYAYSRLPTMHLLIGTNSILTGLNYKWSSIISVSIPQLISFVVLYLIGRTIFKPKIGLLAALLLCLSANYISLGYWIHPTAFALIASAFLLFFLIKEDKHDSSADAAIKILFGFLIVTAHMQVALSIFMVLIAFWIGKKSYTAIKNGKLDLINSNKVKYVFIILFGVIMFSWWIYVADKFELPLKLINMALQHDPSKIKDVTTSMLKIPYNKYLMNIMPYLFFYGFSIVGFFYSISKKSNSNYFALTMSGLLLLATPFLLLESNMSGFLAERWIYAAQLFMSIPVAVGLVIILNIKKRKTAYKAVFIILLVSTFAFVNIINPSANIDNTQLSKDSVVRYALTESELVSINYLQNSYDGYLYTDVINGLPISDENKLNSIEKPLENKNYTKLKGMVILRSILTNAPVHGLKLDYDPVKELSLNTTFTKIYDSKSEIAFINNNI